MTKDGDDKRSKFTNIHISGGVNGIVGSVQDTDFDNININDVENPIDLDRFDRSTINRLNITQNKCDTPQMSKKSTPARKYFGGFSFSKGDHLRKE